jgi:hypothetical protein
MSSIIGDVDEAEDSFSRLRTLGDVQIGGLPREQIVGLGASIQLAELLLRALLFLKILDKEKPRVLWMKKCWRGICLFVVQRPGAAVEIQLTIPPDAVDLGIFRLCWRLGRILNIAMCSATSDANW